MLPESYLHHQYLEDNNGTYYKEYRLYKDYSIGEMTKEGAVYNKLRLITTLHLEKDQKYKDAYYSDIIKEQLDKYYS